MITNQSKAIDKSWDGAWVFGLFAAVLGLVWGFAALCTGDYIWMLSFIAPAVFSVLAFLLFTNAYEVLDGVQLNLLKAYENAPQQVRDDLGPLTAKDIQSLSFKDADRVLDALRSLQRAYNQHSEAVPDSRVAVLLDNAKTAEQAYRELTSTGA